MSTLLASNRIAPLQRHLGVAIAAEIVDRRPVGRGLVAWLAPLDGDGGARGGDVGFAVGHFGWMGWGDDDGDVGL